MKKFLLFFAIIFIFTGCTNLHQQSITQPSSTSVMASSSSSLQSGTNDAISVNGKKIYTSTISGYTVQYPDQLNVSAEGFNQNLKGTYYSSIFSLPVEGLSLPNYWITVTPENLDQNDTNSYNWFPSNVINSFFQTKVGGSVLSRPGQEGDPDAVKFWTYKRLQNTTIQGYNAIIVENSSVWESPKGTKERRIYFRANGKLYTIGCYYLTSAEFKDCQKFISSFTLTK